MSHTVNVKIEIQNKEALAKAIEVMGGQVLSGDVHRLFETSENGMGFRLPNWQYPLVLKDNGELAYDDYHGSWGNIKDLDTLREWYALGAAQARATELGWYTEFEKEAKKLTIYHPEGGTIIVDGSGKVESFGFQGKSCTEATAPIEAALGTPVSQELKPEYNKLHLEQGATE